MLDISEKIAIKCSECGKYNNIGLNIFKLHIPTNIICDCGNKVLKMWIKNEDVIFQIKCPICENIHIYKFKLKDIVEKNINIFSCQETGIEIGFVGKSNSIDDLIRKHNMDMCELMNYFGVSSDIVSEFPR